MCSPIAGAWFQSEAANPERERVPELSLKSGPMSPPSPSRGGNSGSAAEGELVPTKGHREAEESAGGRCRRLAGTPRHPRPLGKTTEATPFPGLPLPLPSREHDSKDAAP